jgi:hypothetical protein
MASVWHTCCPYDIFERIQCLGCDPLLIFHGAENGYSRRVAELKRHHLDVKVL